MMMIRDENSFNIIGGDGQFAIFHQMGEWEYKIYLCHQWCSTKWAVSHNGRLTLGTVAGAIGGTVDELFAHIDESMC